VQVRGQPSLRFDGAEVLRLITQHAAKILDQGGTAARRRGPAIAPGLWPWGGPGRRAPALTPSALTLIDRLTRAARPVLHGAVNLDVRLSAPGRRV
jgi:hypothetical protein